MYWTIILFFVGFFILIRGANWLIGGASSIAKRFNISNWIIGVAIVGIGTSIPEFGITLASVFKGEWSIGLGTIIGSNTFNILLILGLVAILNPIQAKRQWVKKDLTMNFLAVVVAL